MKPFLEDETAAVVAVATAGYEGRFIEEVSRTSAKSVRSMPPVQPPAQPTKCLALAELLNPAVPNQGKPNQYTDCLS